MDFKYDVIVIGAGHAMATNVLMPTPASLDSSN